MTDIIQRMIDRAIESGSITQKQKEKIIAKAQKMGDDIDEVEIMLEYIALEDEPAADSQNEMTSHRIKKCPHCGATLSDFMLKCPECGYVFSEESSVSKRNRNYLSDLHSRLQKVECRTAKTKDEKEFENILKKNKQKEKINLIKSFSVPNTKEALIQGLLGCYAAYESSRDENSFFDKMTGVVDVSSAWLGKAKEFYYLLQSQPAIDTQTAEVLEKYKPLFVSADRNDDKQRKHKRTIIFIAVLGIVLIYLGIIILSFVEI